MTSYLIVYISYLIVYISPTVHIPPPDVVSDSLMYMNFGKCWEDPGIFNNFLIISPSPDNISGGLATFAFQLRDRKARLGRNTPSPKSDFCFWQNSALISRFLIFMFSVDFKAFSASATVANSMKANLQRKQIFH